MSCIWPHCFFLGFPEVISLYFNWQKHLSSDGRGVKTSMCIYINALMRNCHLHGLVTPHSAPSDPVCMTRP